MDTGQWVVVILSGIFILWYAGGALYNRRRGEDVYLWLARGLRKPDEEKWNGFLRSTARLFWKRPKGELRNLEIIFTLLPRENLPLYLFRLLQGEKDTLYLRADFPTPPRQEMEVGRRADKGFSAALATHLQSPYETLPAEGAFLFARRGEKNAASLEAFRAFAQRYEAALQRGSLRKKRPHLSLKMTLGALQREEAKAFLEALQRLGV